MEVTYKPILCLDFDGVCHLEPEYQQEDVITGVPVPGLFEALLSYTQIFDVQIFSTRSRSLAGRMAMFNWLNTNYVDWCLANQLSTTDLNVVFPASKPSATVALDDRVLNFRGVWPDVNYLKEFKPWYVPNSAP